MICLSVRPIKSLSVPCKPRIRNESSLATISGEKLLNRERNIPINTNHMNTFLTPLTGQLSQGRTSTHPGKDKWDKMAIWLCNWTDNCRPACPRDNLNLSPFVPVAGLVWPGHRLAQNLCVYWFSCPSWGERKRDITSILSIEALIWMKVAHRRSLLQTYMRCIYSCASSREPWHSMWQWRRGSGAPPWA